MLSIGSNYRESLGCPEPYLKRIGAAGFSHVHWCHHWNDDFFYTRPEIEQIRAWLKDNSLQLNDVHASAGQEKCWSSPFEYERQAGVELVRNRIDMAAALGADVIVMHLFGAPDYISWPGRPDRFMDSLFKSLDELEPHARERGVRIALENGFFEFLDQALPLYDPAYVGLCYDVGHGNFGGGKGLISLEQYKDRLIAIHLHDNDETDDMHDVPFTRTVDWDRLARIVAASSYDKCPTIETGMAKAGIEDEQEFLSKVYEAGVRFMRMVDGYRTLDQTQ